MYGGEVLRPSPTHCAIPKTKGLHGGANPAGDSTGDSVGLYIYVYSIGALLVGNENQLIFFLSLCQERMNICSWQDPPGGVARPRSCHHMTGCSIYFWGWQDRQWQNLSGTFQIECGVRCPCPEGCTASSTSIATRSFKLVLPVLPPLVTHSPNWTIRVKTPSGGGLAGVLPPPFSRDWKFSTCNSVACAVQIQKEIAKIANVQSL